MLECPSCRTGNQDSALFCSACGTKLTPAPSSVRKVVTVLFCDLVGSTALGDGADPEVLREQMARYHAELRRILENHGGTVEKFIGDAVMAVFGLPMTHEDDALRAVRAASEITGSTHTLGLSVRIGINTGEVVAGEGETLVAGDAVNVAARLEQSASSGEILIGELTERLVRDQTSTQPVNELSVKEGRAVRAYRLLEDPGVRQELRERQSSAFVGRTAELLVLERALARATEDGLPQLATVVGPPGIGKSRLVRELVDRSRARIVAGRCLSYGQGITYWPLQEIAQQIGDVGLALGSGANAKLAAARLDAALGDTPATPDEIAWGFRTLFESLARKQPLIVVIDDIHWAEPALLDLIQYLADFSRDAPLLVLCTARAELLEIRPEWSAPRPNATVVILEPLPASDAETLVEQLAAVSSIDRQRIIDAAEGNPLFVEQLVAMRAEDSGSTELDIPPTIQALLSARIDRLEADERAVIERASVEGRLFHRGSVQHLVPQRMRPDVGRKLLALVRRQFIHPDQAELPGDDGFRFDHVLIRDAAYDSLPKKVRAELHERFAGWLEERLGSDVPAEIVGYHLEQAHRYRRELGTADDVVAERAARWLIDAARSASLRRDLHAEVVFLERAVALLPDGASTRARALADLGVAVSESGNTARGIELLAEAENRARQEKDYSTEWVARLTRIRLGLQTVPEGAAELLTREAQAALNADTHDREVEARALWMMATAYSYEGRMADLLELTQVAWEHARSVGNARLEADIFWLTSPSIVFGPLPVQDAFAWVTKVVDGARNRSAADAWSSHMLAHLYARLGDAGSAHDTMDRWRSEISANSASATNIWSPPVVSGTSAGWPMTGQAANKPSERSTSSTSGWATGISARSWLRCSPTL